MDVFLGYNSERYGPYTPEEVKRHHLNKDLAADYWIWHEGLDHWISVREFLDRHFGSEDGVAQVPDWMPEGDAMRFDEISQTKLLRITDRIATTRQVYIYQDQKTLGPFKMGDVERQLADGTLRVDAGMWFQGLDKWVHLGQSIEHFRKTKDFSKLPLAKSPAMPQLPRLSPQDRLRVTQKFAKRTTKGPASGVTNTTTQTS